MNRPAREVGPGGIVAHGVVGDRLGQSVGQDAPRRATDGVVLPPRHVAVGIGLGDAVSLLVDLESGDSAQRIHDLDQPSLPIIGGVSHESCRIGLGDHAASRVIGHTPIGSIREDDTGNATGIVVLPGGDVARRIGRGLLATERIVGGRRGVTEGIGSRDLTTRRVVGEGHRAPTLVGPGDDPAGAWS